MTRNNRVDSAIEELFRIVERAETRQANTLNRCEHESGESYFGSGDAQRDCQRPAAVTDLETQKAYCLKHWEM